MIPPHLVERERQADGTFRVLCSECRVSVSSPLPAPVIVRAYVVCPECIQAGALERIVRDDDGAE